MNRYEKDSKAKFLSARKVKRSEALLNIFVSRYLQNRSKLFRKNSESSPLVVYAHDVIGIEINVKGAYEIDFLEAIRSVFENLEIDSKKFSAIDIGANIGNHTMFLSKVFSKVEAFEPHPRTSQILELNTLELKNVCRHTQALSDRSDTGFLHSINTNLGASFVSSEKLEATDSRIQLEKLDDYLEHFKSVKFVKIDVERMEYRVLLGAKDVIEAFRPVIAFEQHAEDFLGQDDGTLATKFLESLEYQIFWSEMAHLSEHRFLRLFRKATWLMLGKKEFVLKPTDGRVPIGYHSMLFAIPKELLIVG